METILVKTDNEEQVKLVQDFLEKHKLKSRVLLSFTSGVLPIV